MSDATEATVGPARRSGVFREKAVESLSSPSDQLDQLVKVTSPRVWLALLGLVAVVVGVVLYGFFGTAATTVSGRGLFLPPGGLVGVDAPVAGTVTELHLGVGDSASEGFPVVTISTPEGVDVPVMSAASGHVTELLVGRGNVVAAGSELAVVSPEDAELSAIVYVPAGPGKAIEPGMGVRLSPSTAPSEEYGQVLATVVSVSEFPVSPQRLAFVLRNDLIAGQISALAVLEVVVEVTTDPDTPSGLKWTSGQGPPFEVHNGTLTGASVIIDTKTPAQNLFDPEA